MNLTQEEIWKLVETYALPFVFSLATLLIGLFIIKVLLRVLNKQMVKRNLDESLRPFLSSMLSITLKVCLIFSVIGMVGIQTTSFVAIFAAAGLAIGMALQGTLQNFAGGVMILLFKPYKVGDYIEAQGFQGIVHEIQIFNTILKTLDHRTIILPNSPVSTSPITNFTDEKIRRVDWTFGIGYGEDANKAISLLNRLITEDSRILKDPAHFVALEALADSSVNFVTRAWCKTDEYWDVYFDMNKKVYEEFEKEGLSIPYPQMDVHVHKN